MRCLPMEGNLHIQFPRSLYDDCSHRPSCIKHKNSIELGKNLTIKMLCALEPYLFLDSEQQTKRTITVLLLGKYQSQSNSNLVIGTQGSCTIGSDVLFIKYRFYTYCIPNCINMAGEGNRRGIITIHPGEDITEKVLDISHLLVFQLLDKVAT